MMPTGVPFSVMICPVSGLTGGGMLLKGGHR